MQRKKHRFWINNGRTNHIWQTAYHDRLLPFRQDRFPMSPLEMNPEDAKSLGTQSGDIVELHNDFGSTFAMAYLEPDIDGRTKARAISGDTCPMSLELRGGGFASIEALSRDSRCRPSG